MLPVESPFKTYTGTDGKPLDGGYVYFGQANQNPITAPVTVYWDAAGTQPAAQPLRTVNGYIVRSGTPANVFFTGSYSELVQDSKRKQVFYARTSDDFSIATVVSNFISSLASSTGSSLIGFIQAGVGPVLRTVQDKLRDLRASVKDFGAVVNGVTNDATAIMKTITARTQLQLGRGSSAVSSTITTFAGTDIQGVTQTKAGAAVSDADVLITSALIGISIGGHGNKHAGMTIQPVVSNQVGSIGISGSDKYFYVLEDALVQNFETGIQQTKSLYHTYRRTDAQGGKFGAVFVGTGGAWNIDWFNNVITMENCRIRQNSDTNLDFQGQGLKATNCDFSGGATAGAKAAVRVRAGTKDADFDTCYIEALGVGAYPYLIEGGTVHIRGGFVQGGASGSRCQALVRATGGSKVVIDGLTGQDYFNNLYEADGAGTVIYIMPGTNLNAAFTTFKSETNGGKVIDLSTFDPSTKIDASLFFSDSVSIANGGTYTYQLTSSESVNIRAYLSLNGGANLYSVTGTAMWVNFGGGSGNSLSNLVSSSGSVTVAISNATGVLTITNSSGFAGTIRFKAQLR
jgi:hypothetical protein